MSRVAHVVEFRRTSEDGIHIALLKLDPGGDGITVVHNGAPGDDAQPLAGDSVVFDEDRDNAVGYADTKNAGKAGPGERRIYARDADGAPVVELWLKADGSLLITNEKVRVELKADGTQTLKNENGSIEMASGGNVTINGVVIDTDGNVKAPGEVTAKAQSPATSVSLSTHLDGHPMGPTTGPIPGT